MEYTIQKTNYLGGISIHFERKITNVSSINLILDFGHCITHLVKKVMYLVQASASLMVANS